MDKRDDTATVDIIDLGTATEETKGGLKPDLDDHGGQQIGIVED